MFFFSCRGGVAIHAKSALISNENSVIGILYTSKCTLVVDSAHTSGCHMCALEIHRKSRCRVDLCICKYMLVRTFYDENGIASCKECNLAGFAINNC